MLKLFPAGAPGVLLLMLLLLLLLLLLLAPSFGAFKTPLTQKRKKKRTQMNQGGAGGTTLPSQESPVVVANQSNHPLDRDKPLPEPQTGRKTCPKSSIEFKFKFIRAACFSAPPPPPFVTPSKRLLTLCLLAVVTACGMTRRAYGTARGVARKKRTPPPLQPQLPRTMLLPSLPQPVLLLQSLTTLLLYSFFSPGAVVPLNSATRHETVLSLSPCLSLPMLTYYQTHGRKKRRLFRL